MRTQCRLLPRLSSGHARSLLRPPDMRSLVPMTDHHIPRRALILLVILTFVWGTNWPLFAFAVREVSVWTFRAVAVVGAGDRKSVV